MVGQRERNQVSQNKKALTCRRICLSALVCGLEANVEGCESRSGRYRYPMYPYGQWFELVCMFPQILNFVFCDNNPGPG
jgi:hypothetical protein